MPVASSNGIDICYETFGGRSDPCVLLIMGLGSQMIAWPDGLCEALASRGFFVVRFDNRDVGESTWFDEAPKLELMDVLEGRAVYTLSDMASDAISVLDALGVERAHIVGASLGGMVAQTVALEHPARVLSLVSIMSHPGGNDALPPTPEAVAALLVPRPNSREEAQERAVEVWRVIGSPGFPRDEDRLRDVAGRSWDRGVNPPGFLRQLAAVAASPSRVERLGSLSIPVCVVHGDADPLVPPDNGRRTAAAVPGAELVMIPGMGHDLPAGAWEPILDAITRTIAKARSGPGLQPA